MPPALPAPKKYSHADADTLHNTLRMLTLFAQHQCANQFDRSATPALASHKSHYFQLEILTDDALGFIKFLAAPTNHRHARCIFVLCFLLVCRWCVVMEYTGFFCNRKHCSATYSCKVVLNKSAYTHVRMEHTHSVSANNFIGSEAKQYTSFHKVGCRDEDEDGGTTSGRQSVCGVPHLV